MNQKEAVFEAVKSLKPDTVETDEAVVLTKQEKQVVTQKLFDGFKKGKVAYNHDMPSDDKLLMYVSGLVSNWLRKDKRLNGQTNYVPKRPVIRSQQIDAEQLKALRTLTHTTGDSSEEVQVFVIKKSSPSNMQAGTQTVERMNIPSITEELSELLK